MVLNDDNRNNLYSKISLKVTSHFHGDKTSIIKGFFVYKFSVPPNIISPNGNTLERNL